MKCMHSSYARLVVCVMILKLFREKVAIGLSPASFSTKNGTTQKRVKVAIIGGGIAGLSCAQQLLSQATLKISSAIAMDVTVYDTGRLRPGGRCSSRQIADPLKKDSNEHTNGLLSRFLYDHAAQMLTNPDSSRNPLLQEFSNALLEWQREGTIIPFPSNSVFNIDSRKKMEPISSNMFHGTEGMGSIPTKMVQSLKYSSSSSSTFELHQDVWISPSNGVSYQTKTQKWQVRRGNMSESYDYLIIAHNGKCADRLMSRTPATALHNLLRVNFSSMASKTRMNLNSIYSLTFAVPASNSVFSNHLPETFIAGYVHNHPSIRFLTCQTRKYGNDKRDTESDIEVWTVLSSATFAKKYKAPQEFLPDDTVTEVTRLLLMAVEESVDSKNPEMHGSHGKRERSDSDEQNTNNMSMLETTILDRNLQLWGAAVPLNTWETVSPADAVRTKAQAAGFLYDASHRVGACGDWLVESSIAGAWTSGRLLANHVIESIDSPSSCTSHGLDDSGRFRTSLGALQQGIGDLIAQ